MAALLGSGTKSVDVCQEHRVLASLASFAHRASARVLVLRRRDPFIVSQRAVSTTTNIILTKDPLGFEKIAAVLTLGHRSWDFRCPPCNDHPASFGTDRSCPVGPCYSCFRLRCFIGLPANLRSLSLSAKAV